jgi:hypothetical protein
MKPGKLGFNSIRAEAEALAGNKGAQDFVQGAAPAPAAAAAKPIRAKAGAAEARSEARPAKISSSSHGRKLILEGWLKDRAQNCGRPLQLYLRNALAEWIARHASGGKGGQQLVINYLIERGIEAVEKDYARSGTIFVSEDD